MNNDASITVRLDTEVKKALEEHANNDATTLSQIVKKLVLDFARDKKLVK
mgnify:FL=1|tara:strand:- start:496 stop:645 length:150 start_codon:yes stop_codon:yes gene_type:complete